MTTDNVALPLRLLTLFFDDVLFKTETKIPFSTKSEPINNSLDLAKQQVGKIP